MIDLGPASTFTELPAIVTLDSGDYYLDRTEDGFCLLSTTCPHQGGTVAPKGAVFECDGHGWQFDPKSGRCLNSPSQSLLSIPVILKNDHLFVDSVKESLPERMLLQPHTVDSSSLDLRINMHGHASLEFLSKGFSLLTDPWLIGTAFLGGWFHYPPRVIDVDEVNTDAILITHEHSDHFHEPTLSRLDRDIRVYVPDFPNQRMQISLAKMGFYDVISMKFGQPYKIADNIEITCFEPGSSWNDSIFLIEIDGFKILNLNDAGINRRIAKLVAPVDVVASSFSPGASGYPATWQHLADEQKTSIYEKACQGRISMLKEALRVYGAQALIPFASHFALWHPSHEKYMKILRRNTLDDICEAFDEEEARVIDMLPGEGWEVQSDQIDRLWLRRDRIYDPQHIRRYVERHYNDEEFYSYHPTMANLRAEDVEEYFLRLNLVPEIKLTEDLTATFSALGSDGNEEFSVSFEIAGGQLHILESQPSVPNIEARVPTPVFRHVIESDLSWDEAIIGYWCEFSRHPDVYHSGFWRLLQAPYYMTPFNPADYGSRIEPVSSSSVIAEIVEDVGRPASRVIERYGIYCNACSHSTYCSIATAASAHGIAASQVINMVTELNAVIGVQDSPSVEAVSPIGND